MREMGWGASTGVRAQVAFELEAAMTHDKAAGLAAMVWESRRSEIIEWMIARRGFSRKGAAKAFHSFIETMIFVAEETGDPQI